MAGTFTRANLANIQLANSKGDVYSPSSVTGLIHNILLHNTNSTTETVELLYDDGSNEYQIYKKDLAANETLQLDYPNEGLVVPDAAKITGNTTTASKVTCLISGSTEA